MTNEEVLHYRTFFLQPKTYDLPVVVVVVVVFLLADVNDNAMMIAKIKPLLSAPNNRP